MIYNKYNSWQYKICNSLRLRRASEQILSISFADYIFAASKFTKVPGYDSKRYIAEFQVNQDKHPYYFMYRNIRWYRREEVGYILGEIVSKESETQIEFTAYPGESSILYILMIPFLCPVASLFFLSLTQIAIDIQTLFSEIGLLCGFSGFVLFICVIFLFGLFSEMIDTASAFKEMNNTIVSLSLNT